MIFLRKLLLYVFIAIYCVVCPLLVLRMLGFVSLPGKGLVKTGLIYISTNPPEAKVVIDGVIAHESTPTVIRDLPPGEHDVEIKLDGYGPWQKNIPVAGNKATVLDNVLLVPDAWKTKAIAQADFNMLIPLPGGLSLMAGRGKTIDGTMLVRPNKDAEEADPLFPSESIYEGTRVMGYFTVDKSPFFVLHILDGDKNKYLWVDPREKQPHAEDITELLIGEPKQLAWEPSDEKNIFALQGTTVNRLNIKAKAIYPAVMEGVKALGVMDNAVFGLIGTDVLIRCDYDGQNKKEASLDTKELMLLAAQNPDLLPYAMGQIGTVPDIRGISLDHDRSLALIWIKNRAGILDYSRDALASHQPMTVRWIYTRGRDITQAFWINDGSNILIRDNSRIIVLDKENFGKSRLIPVTSVEADSAVYFSEKTGKLYYLAPGTRRLSWVQVVHHKPLIPAPIAESLRIKKLEQL